MGEACKTAGDWKIFAWAVLSFLVLTRLGEIGTKRLTSTCGDGHGPRNCEHWD